MGVNRMAKRRVRMSNKRLSRRLLVYILVLSSYIIGYNVYNNTDKITNNIYYEDDTFKIDEDEIEKMLDELSSELNRELTEDDINSLLLYAVYKNNNLKEEDKEKIYDLVDLINDNNYIDKDKAYRNLYKLKIYYLEKNNHIIDSNVQAQYSFPEDVIKVFDNKMINIYHELIHCIFYNETSEHLPNFFLEGMTQILTREYFSDIPYLETDTYIYESIISKILCELTSTDNVLKAFSSGDINFITSELVKDSSYSIEEINTIVKNIDKLFSTDYFEENTYINTLNLFIDLYNHKKDDENFDNTQYLYLIDLFKRLDSDNRFYSYFDYMEKYGVSDKIYFNSKLKNKDISYLTYSFDLSDSMYYKVYLRKD